MWSSCMACTATLSFLLFLASARALWVPKELEDDAAFWITEDFGPFAKRDDGLCGGHASLTPCGGAFPAHFCCGTKTDCLLLNTTSTITAALCCPAGQDCAIISPVSCDKAFQDATSNPSSQLHADPIADLAKCGSACCPMGYRCQGSNCVALTANEAASSTPSSSSTAVSSLSAASGSASTSEIAMAEAASPTATLSTTPMHTSSAAFSPKVFAAGFVPGIVLGLVLAAAIFFCFCFRRRKDKIDRNEKKHRRGRGRDTLTDLGTNVVSRPTIHGRSISEPVVDASMGHRTDFLNHIPPSSRKSNSIQCSLSGYVVNVQSPAKDPITLPPQTKTPVSHQKRWHSRSPFVNQVASPVPAQAPMPAHLKRGTLSFQISPVRSLKEQRSMHSLRRQMTDASHSTRRGDKAGGTRVNSTEEIKVGMVSPDQQTSSTGTSASTIHQPYLGSNAHQLPRHINRAGTSGSFSWQTTTSGVSEDISPVEEEADYSTPTRPGRNGDVRKIGGASLQSSHMPSQNYGPAHRALKPELNARDFTREPISYAARTQLGTYAVGTEPRHEFSRNVAADTGHGYQLPRPPPIPDSNHNDGGYSAHSDGDHDIRGSKTWRNTNMTTFSSLMQKAGLRSSALYTKADDSREYNRDWK